MLSDTITIVEWWWWWGTQEWLWGLLGVNDEKSEERLHYLCWSPRTCLLNLYLKQGYQGIICFENKSGQRFPFRLFDCLIIVIQTYRWFSPSMYLPQSYSCFKGSEARIKKCPRWDPYTWKTPFAFAIRLYERSFMTTDRRGKDAQSSERELHRISPSPLPHTLSTE